MFTIRHISPMIPSFNIPVTVSFFKELLDFSVVRDEGNYVILQRDGAMVHILRAGEIGEMDCYIEVDNVDQVWERIKDRLDNLKVKPPFDRDYGMRELHLIVPETKTLLFLGHPIA